ncbi:MAG: M23 family metallopeptidase [Erythrobacter sp.]|jgi:murein DD-endopeptidase MepM/ murein hydrolase activator NlpD|uniref:M23 family metallopeptidase n=1 Tax=Qipengyuania citrea TaxID=225971 RepID=UPI00209F95A3|nr:peptidoglycan DD-metalloendopeptidase family protein [Qipengyuania citrea]MCP2016674.1 murein DD-endopeptidase MepM/ murein hydrolase activator NlpD [Qipengyuania citrea]MDE0900752.1 M23 family metallopeptidase [Erythrobacter sp.]
MNLVDRILTIVVTATITSAIWIVAGGSLIENATSTGQREATRPAEAAPSPSASDTSADGTGTDSDVLAVGALDAQLAAAPSAAQSRQLLIPVQNIRPADLTDTYSDSRGGGTRLHEALDIMAPKGTSVLSSAPGTIEKLFRSKAGGNTIYVRSTDGETIYYYAHLDAYAEGLREGQRVRRGQRLGMVGSSGNASAEAPHLHFAILQTTADAEWWEPANAVNPYPLLTAD